MPNLWAGIRGDDTAAGVRYEGEWKDGVEHGVGTLIEVDGSTFYGFWADGKMHGEGVRILHHIDSFSIFACLHSISDALLALRLWLSAGWAGVVQVYKPASGADVITMRDYAEGVLRKENVLRIGHVDHHKNEVKADRTLRSEEKRASAKVCEPRTRDILEHTVCLSITRVAWVMDPQDGTFAFNFVILVAKGDVGGCTSVLFFAYSCSYQKCAKV